MASGNYCVPGSDKVRLAGAKAAVIPDCGDTDSSAAPSALSMPPISHWTTVGFCNGCPGGAERSMSQGLRVLVLVLGPLRPPAWPSQMVDLVGKFGASRAFVTSLLQS